MARLRVVNGLWKIGEYPVLVHDEYQVGRQLLFLVCGVGNAGVGEPIHYG